MLRTCIIAAVSAAVLMFSSTVFAQQTGGTAEEAKAMLVKAVAAVKEDKTKALDMFNKGEGGIPGPRPLCVLRQRQRRHNRCHGQS